MTATFSEARDQILGTFKTAWDANSGAVNGGAVPSLHYEGLKFDPPKDAAWARITIRHSTAGQATLAGDPSFGRRRFEKFGVVTVQIFQPLSSGGGLVLAENLAQVAKAAFEGKATTGQVWFQNVAINEVGVDGPWFQMNVVASFRYDEIV
jgi:hypothetical protein